MSESDGSRRMTEWLRVMLEEIERKKEETARAGEERRRRSQPPDASQEK